MNHDKIIPRDSCLYLFHREIDLAGYTSLGDFFTQRTLRFLTDGLTKWRLLTSASTETIELKQNLERLVTFLSQRVSFRECSIFWAPSEGVKQTQLLRFVRATWTEVIRTCLCPSLCSGLCQCLFASGEEVGSTDFRIMSLSSSRNAEVSDTDQQQEQEHHAPEVRMSMQEKRRRNKVGWRMKKCCNGH